MTAARSALALTITDLAVPRGDRPVLHRCRSRSPPARSRPCSAQRRRQEHLVLTVGGALKPTGGSIRVGDLELAGSKPDKVRGAGVAVVPEGRRLLPSLSVRDNLKVATYNMPASEADAGLAYALELFPELEKRIDTSARSLSGGEQQMVVLAQALASKPRSCSSTSCRSVSHRWS
jgi:branched-chain amino acid transport system ATP-binding protein